MKEWNQEEQIFRTVIEGIIKSLSKSISWPDSLDTDLDPISIISNLPELNLRWFASSLSLRFLIQVVNVGGGITKVGGMLK